MVKGKQACKKSRGFIFKKQVELLTNQIKIIRLRPNKKLIKHIGNQG
jgi:hypothetical protein